MTLTEIPEEMKLELMKLKFTKSARYALEMELNKAYIGATKAYEIELENNANSPIDIYINLTFLYWSFAADYGFTSYYDIPNEWGNLGAERYPEVLEMALEKYPEHVELHFLKRYLRHRFTYDDFTQEECEEIVERYGDEESLVPYFFLYLFDKEKRDELRKECEKLLTLKNIYILGFGD